MCVACGVRQIGFFSNNKGCVKIQMHLEANTTSITQHSTHNSNVPAFNANSSLNTQHTTHNGNVPAFNANSSLNTQHITAMSQLSMLTPHSTLNTQHIIITPHFPIIKYISYKSFTHNYYIFTILLCGRNHIKNASICDCFFDLKWRLVNGTTKVEY